MAQKSFNLIFETDTAGIITVDNLALRQVTGFKSEELTGQSYQLLIHPCMPKEVLLDLQETISLGAQWTGIIKLNCINNEFLWENFTVTPVYKGSNKIIGFRFSGQKATDEQVKDVQQLYKDINSGKQRLISTLSSRQQSAGFLGRFSLNQKIIFPFIVMLLGQGVAIATLLMNTDYHYAILASVISSSIALALMFWVISDTKSVIDQFFKGLRSFDRGNFSARIDYYGNNELGLMARLFNRSVDLVESSLNDINQSISALGKGDFGYRIELTMEKDFESTKSSVNATYARLESILYLLKQHIKALSTGDLFEVNDDQAEGEYKILFEYISQIQVMQHNRLIEMIDCVNAAAQGDFSKRMSENTKPSSNTLLEKQINRLFNAVEENLSDFSRIVDQLAQGKLNEQITTIYPGVFGKTADGINYLRQTLIDMINLMTDSVNVIHKASLQISNDNIDFAQRTELQSVNLQKNTRSMHDLSAKVKETADIAKIANELIVTTSNTAIQGGKAVHEVVSTMNAISESALKVSNIITLIDEIAFQTNILALNAAVEAARAGPQGSGFAVVANEVRTLAQRSANAAKEIKELIGISVANVKKGNECVTDAGATINNVVDSVAQVTKLMAKISLASAEQGLGIDQVSDLITQIDTITKMNDALALESIDSASVLEKQSRVLAEMLSNFFPSSEKHSETVSNQPQSDDISIKFELF